LLIVGILRFPKRIAVSRETIPLLLNFMKIGNSIADFGEIRHHLMTANGG
jgi:hypothetical protein